MFKSFFTGSIRGSGIIQNWRRRVIHQFDVEMSGSWDDNRGILNEKFSYYNGNIEHRTWTIVAADDGSCTATASDVVGVAVGRPDAGGFHWDYVMDIDIGSRRMRFRFDDWMWMMHDNTVINRSRMIKMGIPVAELTIFLRK